MSSESEESLQKVQLDYKVNRYKKWFKEKVDQGNYVASTKVRSTGTLSDENVWGLKAGAPITQSVLDDAFAHQKEVIDTLKSSGIEAEGRGYSKSWSEVKQNFGKGFNAYKDAITVRILFTQMSELSVIVSKINNIIDAVGGSKRVNYERDPDIVYFIHWYNPAIGHTIQIQIYHRFAALTFERDYLLETTSGGKVQNTKYIDPWDEDIYIDVRDALINRRAWHEIWRRNPKMLWLDRLDKLIYEKHNHETTPERVEDEKLKVEVDKILSSAFFDAEYNIAGIYNPSQTEPSSGDPPGDNSQGDHSKNQGGSAPGSQSEGSSTAVPTPGSSSYAGTAQESRYAQFLRGIPPPRVLGSHGVLNGQPFHAPPVARVLGSHGVLHRQPFIPTAVTGLSQPAYFRTGVWPHFSSSTLDDLTPSATEDKIISTLESLRHIDTMDTSEMWLDNDEQEEADRARGLENCQDMTDCANCGNSAHCVSSRNLENCTNCVSCRGKPSVAIEAS